MRRGAILLSVLLLLAIGSGVGGTPAHAQGRDPFRPPAGSGTVDGSGSNGGTQTPPAVQPPAGSNDDLAHTGQDVSGVVALGLALLGLGAALRVAGRRLDVSPGRG